MSTHEQPLVDRVLNVMGDMSIEYSPVNPDTDRKNLVAQFLRDHPDVAHLEPELNALVKVSMLAQRGHSMRLGREAAKSVGAHQIAEKVEHAILGGR